MSTNTIVYAWKRSVPGREQMSAAHFEEFIGYLSGLQGQGVIQSFEPILLDPNGSGIIGFFVIKLADGKTGDVLGRSDFYEHIVRSMVHVEDPVLTCAVTGPAVRERMVAWMQAIPK